MIHIDTERDEDIVFIPFYIYNTRINGWDKINPKRNNWYTIPEWTDNINKVIELIDDIYVVLYKNGERRIYKAITDFNITLKTIQTNEIKSN